MAKEYKFIRVNVSTYWAIKEKAVHDKKTVLQLLADQYETEEKQPKK